MSLSAILFPASLDPIAFQIGPLAVHWYGLAYAVGYLACWHLALRLASRYNDTAITRDGVERFLMWALIGGVLGGRIGYALFYQPGYYVSHPLEILAVWNGGMSFHGGLLGFVVATLVYTRRTNLQLWPLADIIVVVVPLGLLFGRLANFANQELYGRATQVPWAIVFPASGDGMARHPSQLYEAFFEGLLLFLVLNALYRVTRLRRHPGMITGVFFAGYGLARFFIELLREPDAHLGFLWAGLTLGQWLSLPMILVGGFLIWQRHKNGERPQGQ